MRLALSILITLVIASGPAWAAPPATQPTPLPRSDTAVDLALLHLERLQHPDGHFQAEPKLALTGLVLTSYLSCGHAPDLGRHGSTVRRAVDYFVRSAPDDGYFGKVDASRMYGQAIVVTALCEAYGLEEDPARRVAMRVALVKAVKVILDAQNVKKDATHAGGWRYEPTSTDSDLSVSAGCAIALRAARDVGLEVPDAAIESAAAYLKRCGHPTGGLAYQPGRDPDPSMTGAGVLALSMLGHSEAPEIVAGAKFMRERPIASDARFPYYAMHYVTQASNQIGGETWNGVWPGVQEGLLRTQLPSGAWPQSTSPEEPGEIYATAMAVLTLSAPNRTLPLYQR